MSAAKMVAFTGEERRRPHIVGLAKSRLASLILSPSMTLLRCTDSIVCHTSYVTRVSPSPMCNVHLIAVRI